MRNFALGFLTVLLWFSPILAEDYQVLKRNADQLLKAGDYEKAAEKFEDLSATYPNKPEPLNGLGFALFKGGDFEAAIVAFEKALKLAPNNASTSKNLILASGRRALEMPPGLGIKEFNRVKSRFPNHPQLPALEYYEGQIYFVMGNEEKGQEIWEAVAQSRPSSTTRMFLKGFKQHRAGNPEQAIPSYQAAVKRAPDSPIYRLYLGRAQLTTDRVPDAKKNLTHVANTSSRPEILLQAAALLSLAGAKSEAESALTKATSVGSPMAMLQLGISQGSRSMVERALQADSRALAVFQTGTNIIFLDSQVIGMAPAARFLEGERHRVKLAHGPRQFTREFRAKPGQLYYITFSEEIKIEERARHAGLIPGLK